MTNQEERAASIAPTMRAIRLHAPGEPDDLTLETVETPRLGAGEVLVRVHAAAITKDELGWPVDRLPAIPSYELSGEVAAVGSDVDAVVFPLADAREAFHRTGAKGKRGKVVLRVADEDAR